MMISNNVTFKLKTNIALISLVFLMLTSCGFGRSQFNDIPVTIVEGKVIFTSINRDDNAVTFLLENAEVIPLSKGGMAKFTKDYTKYIAFWKTGFRLYNLDGEVVKNIPLPEEYSPLYYDFSPDDKTIVFVSTMDQKPEYWNLYTINEKGENLKKLTNFGFSVNSMSSPRFSPDGKKIVFDGPKNPDDSHSPASLYLINIDGTGLKELFGDKFIGGWEAAWSPDMKHLAFVSTVDGYRNLFIVDLKTIEVKQITFFDENNYGHVYTPCYSPDGTQICFALKTRGVTAGQELFAINTDGTNLIRLTAPKKTKHYPYWATDKYPDWGK